MGRYFGAKLKKLRMGGTVSDTEPVTQAWLTKELRIKATSLISGIERGEKTPSRPLLKGLSEVFGYPIGDLELELVADSVHDVLERSGLSKLESMVACQRAINALNEAPHESAASKSANKYLRESGHPLFQDGAEISDQPTPEQELAAALGTCLDCLDMDRGTLKLMARRLLTNPLRLPTLAAVVFASVLPERDEERLAQSISALAREWVQPRTG